MLIDVVSFTTLASHKMEEKEETTSPCSKLTRLKFSFTTATEHEHFI